MVTDIFITSLAHTNTNIRTHRWFNSHPTVYYDDLYCNRIEARTPEGWLTCWYIVRATQTQLRDMFVDELERNDKDDVLCADGSIVIFMVQKHRL